MDHEPRHPDAGEALADLVKNTDPVHRMARTLVRDLPGRRTPDAIERATGEKYREGCTLTDADLPNNVLAHLDAVWAGRQVLTYRQRITADMSRGNRGGYLADLERHVLDHLGRDAIDRHLTVLWCSVTWSQVDLGDARIDSWQRDEELEPWAWFVVATARGVAVPMLAPPADVEATVPDSALYLLRCGVAGCAFQQHTTARVGVLRDHPRGAALIDAAPAPFLPHMLTDTNRCPGSGQMAQGFELSGRQR